MSNVKAMVMGSAWRRGSIICRVGLCRRALTGLLVVRNIYCFSFFSGGGEEEMMCAQCEGDGH